MRQPIAGNETEEYKESDPKRIDDLHLFIEDILIPLEKKRNYFNK